MFLRYPCDRPTSQERGVAKSGEVGPDALFPATSNLDNATPLGCRPLSMHPKLSYAVNSGPIAKRARLEDGLVVTGV